MYKKQISNQADGVVRVYSTDLDGDGDQDVLSASSNDDIIAWYENQGGGVFGGQNIISNQVDGASCVYSADLDGDGDQDVLSTSWNGDDVSWYENLGGGIFSLPNILNDQADFASQVIADDMDGDGDLDVISANNWEISWYENLGTGMFSNENIILYEVNGGIHIALADIDGDGDKDIMSSRAKVKWIENIGSGQFSTPNNISSIEFGSEICAGDMDQDGDVDIVTINQLRNFVAWFENLRPTIPVSIPSVENQKNQEILNIYPNPNQNKRLNITLGEQTVPKNVFIQDLQGRVVWQTLLQTQESQINLPALSKGVYLVRAGEQCQKLVVE